MSRIEDKIIQSLLFDEKYARQVVPFINLEYFETKPDKVLVEECVKYLEKYNKLITPDMLIIEISERKDFSQTDFEETKKQLKSYKKESNETEWLTKKTEDFFKKRAVYLAILKSISIIEGEDKQISEDGIPDILQNALSVTFDTKVGHDYLDDSVSRYEFYQRKEDGIRFDLSLFNKITGDVGLRNGTLTLVASRTGGGKSLFMCHVASSTLLQGKNVLYITLEMSEERIAERIDANVLNIPIAEIKHVGKTLFDNKVEKLKEKTRGKLIIKEYPMQSAHAGHFRLLLNELKTKRNFVPDLIVIDYLNLCNSQKLRLGSSVNTNTMMTMITQEVRSIAQEMYLPILSAVQLNRGGIASSDVEMGDTADSIGMIFGVDLFFALIRTEELDEMGQVMVKQLKNRYSDPNFFKRFVIGLDTTKMRFYDVENSAQTNISDSGQTSHPAPIKTSKTIEGDGFVF
jgi:hypothetical protein